MQEKDIFWNDEARGKILDDSDRVLREAVLELGDSMKGSSSTEVYEELFSRMKGRFIDFKPGPDIRKYADAIANGEVQSGSAGSSGSAAPSAADPPGNGAPAGDSGAMADDSDSAEPVVNDG